MKKMLVTAAALMLGTSALAWAPAEKAHMDAMGVEAAQADWSKSASSPDKGSLAFSAFDGKGMMKAETVGLEASASAVKSDPNVPEMFAKWEDPSVEQSATASVDMADVKGAVYAASAQEKAPVQSASWDGKAAATMAAPAAMGGPVEEPQGYPACEPGRGDDNCIQLYERGVVNSLAAWKGTEPQVAVGGPYEPAAATGSKDHPAGSTDHQSMDHGHSGAARSHGSAPMTADSGKPAAPVMPQSDNAKPGATDADTSPGAMGGPIEAQAAYPPCRPGRGDDRCIQLYERGVARRD